MPREAHIADALADHVPRDRGVALQTLLDALAAEPERDGAIADLTGRRRQLRQRVGCRRSPPRPGGGHQGAGRGMVPARRRALQLHERGAGADDLQPATGTRMRRGRDRRRPLVPRDGPGRSRHPGRADRREDSALGNDAVVGGSPVFVSPEQACGDDADERSDLNSLGVVAMEIMCGRADDAPRWLSEASQRR